MSRSRDHDSDCTLTESGDGTLEICPPIPEALIGSPSPPRLDAGDLLIETDQSIFSAVGKPESAMGNAYDFFTDGELVEGALVSVEATGGEVPAFSGSVRMLESPILLYPPAGKGDLSRSETLSLNWNVEERTEHVTANSLFALGDDGGGGILTCLFDADAGTGEIDVELLTQVESGAYMDLWATNSARVGTSAGDVRLVAVVPLLRPDSQMAARFRFE